jgi:murein DD-endopeptidase MepM/ murein hydrolase activator NlpD
MILKAKFWGYICAVALVGFIGSRGYTHFFDTSSPDLQLQGIDTDNCYSGELNCSLLSSKKGEISVSLDGKPLVQKFAIAPGEQGHAFSIPTNTLVNGHHTLTADITDSTYRKNKSNIERTFYVDNVPLQAALIKSDDEFKVLQGRTLHVQMQLNKKVKSAQISALYQTYDCFPESPNSTVYEAFIPVACEENAAEYPLAIEVVDAVGNSTNLEDTFQVVSYPFKKSTLHVSNEKMVEEKELGKDNKQVEDFFLSIAQNSPKEKFWRGSFCAPIEVERVSTEYGTVRTTQYKGMYAHKAVDVINTPKSVVWAPQKGKVVVKDRFVDTGNTVMIDHGHGVVTMLCHLDTFADIKEGQMVNKGNPVGTIGKTGYSSGYHLHWEMRINNVHVDPMQWTQPVF